MGMPSFVEEVNRVRFLLAAAHALVQDAVDQLNRLMGLDVMTADGEHIPLPLQVEQLIESTGVRFV